MNEEELKQYIEELIDKKLFDIVQDYADSRDLFSWAKKTDYVAKIKAKGISDGTHPMRLATRVEVWSYILKALEVIGK